MVQVLTVKISKGGVGKTTISLNLANSLARQGKKVLLIDLDAQTSLSKILLRNLEEESYKLTSSNLLANDFDSHEDLIHDLMDNFHFIRADKGLPSVVRYLEENYSASYLKHLRDRLRETFSHYDYIILDLNPGVGDDLTRMAYISADLILAPTEMETTAVDGLVEAMDDLQELREENLIDLKGPEVLIIPNKYNRIYKGENERIYNLLKDNLEEDQLTQPIRQNSNIKKAYSEGKSPIEYEYELLADLEQRKKEGRVKNLNKKIDVKAIEDFEELSKHIMRVL